MFKSGIANRFCAYPELLALVRKFLRGTMRLNKSCSPVLLMMASCLVAAGCTNNPDPDPPPEPAATSGPAEFVGSDSCATCHTSEFIRWQGSHHQLAMQHATPDTVLGDFQSSQFRYFSEQSRFFMRDGGFWVETAGADGQMQEFQVRYTFGVTPLQQYLIEFPDGRLQALSIAWDSRPAGEGGQRWFHLYPDEYIAYDDPLHWTGRQQNWNYMCAECHSTKLQKNYELKSDTFDTRWSEINVGCEACHGPGSHHITQVENGAPEEDFALLVNLDDAARSSWIMNPGTGIAERSELRMSPQQQPEACGRCHARRALSASEYEYGKPLLDAHRVSLLDEFLYFADGQVEDEVYVYGSFIQSKMYRAGVTCSDCHDPHSATLKTGTTASDVCSTCHLPEKFAGSEHHRHNTDAVQCVDCHMPATNYMVVDGRRDHSFRVPRPDLTVTTGSPNACADCHEDQDAEWAAQALAEWYGDNRPAHYATALHAGRGADIGANALLVAAAANDEFPGIARATALSLMRSPYDSNSAEAVRRGLASSDALIRIGALRALAGFPAEPQREWALPLLRDPVRSVRIAAVDLLSPLRDSLPVPEMQNFQRAERELIDAQLAIIERPEALGNLGNLFTEAGNAERALQFYQLALQKQPDSDEIRVNLADLYRRMQQDAQAETLIREGLAQPGNHAALRHALGLLLVREQNHAEALAELGRAAELDPDNARYVFVYAVAQNSLGQSDAAITTLRQASQRFPTDFDITGTLVTVLRDQGRVEEARQAAATLVERFPGNENAQAILQSLQ